MPTAVERLAESIRRTGPIVVAGYGTVGGKVVKMLRDARETTIVIDQQLLPGVDIVGNSAMISKYAQTMSCSSAERSAAWISMRVSSRRRRSKIPAFDVLVRAEAIPAGKIALPSGVDVFIDEAASSRPISSIFWQSSRPTGRTR